MTREYFIYRLQFECKIDNTDNYTNVLPMINCLFYNIEAKEKELQDKLKKCKSYVIDLENQIKEKSNGWMEK